MGRFINKLSVISLLILKMLKKLQRVNKQRPGQDSSVPVFACLDRPSRNDITMNNFSATQLSRHHFARHASHCVCGFVVWSLTNYLNFFQMRTQPIVVMINVLDIWHGPGMWGPKGWLPAVAPSAWPTCPDTAYLFGYVTWGHGIAITRGQRICLIHVGKNI